MNWKSARAVLLGFLSAIPIAAIVYLSFTNSHPIYQLIAGLVSLIGLVSSLLTNYFVYRRLGDDKGNPSAGEKREGSSRVFDRPYSSTTEFGVGVDQLRRGPSSVLVTSKGSSPMDPITFVGLIASLIEIAQFLRGFKEAPTAQLMAQEFRRRQSIATRTAGSVQAAPTPEASITVSDQDLLSAANDVLVLFDTSPDFLNRIEKRCLAPYKSAIGDADDSELDEAKSVARRCVCSNIKRAMDDSNGKFPSDTFRDLWQKFNCAMLA